MPNGITYADLSQAQLIGVVEDHFVLASVRNATGKTYQTPAVGKAANCSYSSLSLPGLNAEEAVGLNLEDNWSNNNHKPKGEGGNEKPQHGVATLLGEKYPICGLTWALVYTHDASATDPEVAIKRMTADQRMTLYAYESWILDEEAQKLLGEAFYAGLPASWLTTLREGFQSLLRRNQRVLSAWVEGPRDPAGATAPLRRGCAVTDPSREKGAGLAGSFLFRRARSL